MKGRVISRATVAIVHRRSGFACEMCGAVRGDADPFSPGAKLHLTVGYISQDVRVGLNRPENLRTLCRNCDDGLKGIIVPPRPNRAQLLAIVQRAAVEDQLHLLHMLRGMRRR